jgi:hypothetical protein
LNFTFVQFSGRTGPVGLASSVYQREIGSEGECWIWAPGAGNSKVVRNTFGAVSSVLRGKDCTLRWGWGDLANFNIRCRGAGFGGFASSNSKELCGGLVCGIAVWAPRAVKSSRVDDTSGTVECGSREVGTSGRRRVIRRNTDVEFRSTALIDWFTGSFRKGSVRRED